MVDCCAASSSTVRHKIRHDARWWRAACSSRSDIKLGMLLDSGSLQAAHLSDIKLVILLQVEVSRPSDIKLDMLLDSGTLQAVLQSDIKLDMSLESGLFQAVRQ